MRVWVFGALLPGRRAVAGPARADDIEETGRHLQGVPRRGRATRSPPRFPVIFGQQEGYLYFQLRDFKSGARKSEVMGGIAADLSRDE